MKHIYTAFLVFLSFNSFCQIIDCNLSYYVESGANTIRAYNPITNTQTNTNIPFNGLSGLAISNNLNGGSPSPTFYAVNGSYQYVWWNGSTWVNTGHSAGGTSFVNPGGSGNYIYNVNGLGGQVSIYNGSGNATVLLNVAPFNGVFDCIGDSEGNLYLLTGQAPNKSMRVYNPQGQLLCTYSLNGIPNFTAGGGYSLINGKLYVNINSGTYVGTFSGSQINFVQTTHFGTSDYASCAFPPFQTTITASSQNINMCLGEPVTLVGSTTITSPIYTWSGPSIVSGQGTSSVVVNQPGTYTLVVTSGGGNCVQTTTTTYVVTASGASATIQPVGVQCVNGDPVQIVASGNQGQWSASCGSCIDNNGLFNPATAGVGTHVVSYEVENCGEPTTLNVVVSDLPAVNAGDDVVVCVGGQVTLNGSGASTYVWSGGVSNGVPFTPSANGTYTVTGTDVNGCVNTDMVNVSLSELVFPEFASINPICVGEQVNPLPTSSLNGIVGTWSPTFNNTQTTTYTFTATSACADNVNVTVEVLTGEVVNAGNDVVVCEGTPVQLLATGGVSYNWSNGVANGGSYTPTVGTHTLTVSGTSNQGCSSSDQLVVVVKPNPILNAGPNVTICSGESVELNATGADEYVWSNGVANATSFVPTQTSTLTVVGITNDCMSSANVLITVNQNPIISAGQDQSGCSSNNFVLSATGAGVNGTYTWNNNVINGTPFVAPVGVTNYVVIGTDVNGCSSSDTVTITTEQVPQLNLQWGLDSECLPVRLKLVNNSHNLVGCSWLVTGVPPINNCQTENIVVLTTPGVYSITFNGVSELGCVVEQNFTNAFQLYPLPEAEFIIRDYTNPYTSFNVSVINNSMNASDYNWYFGVPGSSYSSFEPSHTYSGTGHYPIQLVAYNEAGCTDTMKTVIVIEEDLIYYVPNAFTPDGDINNPEFLPILTSNFDPYNYTMLIYNRWGEIIFETHDVRVGWDGTYGGTPVQDGTYTWTIKFKKLSSDEHVFLTGHVNLIR